MDPKEELLKEQPSTSEFENHTDEIKPEETDQISGGGHRPIRRHLRILTFSSGEFEPSRCLL